MKISINKLLAYLIVIFSLAFAIYYLGSQNSLTRSILSINPTEAFILISLVIVSLLLNGLKILLMLKVFNLNLSLRESISLGAINAMWNYLPLTGGLVARGAYLKKKHKFPWLRFIATVASSYFISLITFGISGLVITIIFIEQGKLIFSAIFFILMITPIIFLWLSKLLKKLNFKYVTHLFTAMVGLERLIKSKRILLVLFLVDFLLIFIDSSRLYLVSIFSETNISFVAALLVTPLTIVASLVNITPGALVIREAIITLTTTQLNYSVETGIVVSTIDRAALVVGIFIGGIIGSIYLARKVSEN